MNNNNAARGKGTFVCFGELLLRLSPPGQELLFQSPRLEARFGGAEANVAASLAILGHAARMASALPSNAAGRACAAELRRHGVDTSGVLFEEGRLGLYFLAPGAMQRPSEVTYDRADSVFSSMPAEAYDWSRLLAGAGWLHLSGINLAVSEVAAQAALAAARAARAAGVRVSFDCNYRGRLWDARATRAPELLRAAMSEADLLFGNDRDIALVLDTEFREDSGEARFLAASQLAFTAFTNLRWMATTERRASDAETQELCGHLATREHVLTTRWHRLAGIVDRIGAGDAFAAGLLHGLTSGMHQPATLDFAVAAACLKHSVPGDVNLLGEAEMLAWLAQDGFEVRR
jgi:2-dehydro-3-deoxygluconokinase